jgi:hypothetical protein
MSPTGKFLVAIEISALNFERALFHRTMRALVHTECIDYVQRKLAGF